MTRRSIAVSLLGMTLLAEPVRIRPTEELNAALHKAIVAGDLGRMKMILDEGAEPNAKDSEGTPALMNAALYASASHMKVLMDRGADVNARNGMEATALIWAAGDAAKARLLMDRGADVNAQSKLGRTPLMVAASVAGNWSTVKLLLAKGARVDVKDNVEPIPVVPVGGGKGTALIDACRTGDLETVRMLLDAGAEVNATDSRNGSALSEAVMYGRRELVKLLLAKGADPTGRVTALKFPYLTLAAMRGDVEIARMLLKHGAAVNVTDASGNTPLMFASRAERGGRAMVEFLLKAGADPEFGKKSGEAAMAGPEASKMGDVTTNEAVARAIAALAKSGTYKKTGCATCHNHTLPMVASSVAAGKGVAVDQGAVDFMKKMVTGMLTPMTPVLLEGSDVPPDIAVTGAYLLEALKAQGYPASRVTAAIVHKVAQSQMADGRWVGWAPRPPMESGDIQATAMAIRALRLYSLAGRQAEIDARIAKARTWLTMARPVTTEEYIMRLEGLRESGASKAMLTDAARRLAALQRPDGGWAQLPQLNSDAYATGKALVALTRARLVAGHNARAAERFLRSTQQADGTWHVVTRSYPLQPLVDAGFPHGRDQWISAAGTSWAAQALAMNLR